MSRLKHETQPNTAHLVLSGGALAIKCRAPGCKHQAKRWIGWKRGSLWKVAGTREGAALCRAQARGESAWSEVHRSRSSIQRLMMKHETQSDIQRDAPPKPQFASGYVIEFSDGGPPEEQVLHVGTKEACERVMGLISAVAYSGSRPNPTARLVIVELAQDSRST
jgi:hypothetical protein